MKYFCFGNFIHDPDIQYGAVDQSESRILGRRVTYGITPSYVQADQKIFWQKNRILVKNGSPYLRTSPYKKREILVQMKSSYTRDGVKKCRKKMI